MTVSECARERVTTNGYGVEVNRQCIEWVDVGTGVYADPRLHAAGERLGERVGREMMSKMFSSKDPFAVRSIGDEAVALGNDMDSLVQQNSCNKPALKRFQENLYRFVERESPLRLPNAASVASARGSNPSKVHARNIDLRKLLDDLILENSKTWMFNRYGRNGVGNVKLVRTGPSGNPLVVGARYEFVTMDNTYYGSVNLHFANGLPKCLYFSDAPQTCRPASRGIVADFEDGKYLKSASPEQAPPRTSEPKRSRTQPPPRRSDLK